MMQLRDCAGGVVFCGEKVFLLKNEKGEWVLPKGLIHTDETPEVTAVNRVREETGIEGEVIDTAGRTYYEFFSITRQHPVCNRIAWFILVTGSEDFQFGMPNKMVEAGFYSIQDAIDRITYSQDRALLRQSWRKYCDKSGWTCEV